MIAQSIYRFCTVPEEIENYYLAITDLDNIWHCHHRKELELNLTVDELKVKGLYYNQPPEDLIFLLPSEHAKLHFEDLRKQGRCHSWKDNVKSPHPALGKFGKDNPKYITLCPALLFTEYCIENKTAEEMAIDHKVSISTLRNRLRHFGISLKTRKVTHNNFYNILESNTLENN